MQSISVKELSEQFERFLVIDVREAWEWEIAHIKGSMHIPLSDITEGVAKLDLNKQIAVICHHGVRSARVVDFLLQRGFTSVYNIHGGIDAWSKQVDPSMSLY